MGGKIKVVHYFNNKTIILKVFFFTFYTLYKIYIINTYYVRMMVFIQFLFCLSYINGII